MTAASIHPHPVVLVPHGGVQLINSLRPPSAAELEQLRLAEERQARRRAVGGGFVFLFMAVVTSIGVVGMPAILGKVFMGAVGLAVLATIVAASSGRLDSIGR